MYRALCLAAAMATTLNAQPRARADFTAHSCLASGPARAIVKGNACVGFSVGSATPVKFPYLGSGQLISSADGRTVAMLQSYIYGRLDKQRNVIAFEGAEQNPTALYIYRDGKLVASHRIHALVQRRSLIWPSVSHVNWVRLATMNRDGRLQLTTTGFRELVFDGRTGALTRAADAPDWTSCTVIAGGKLDLAAGALIKPFDYKKAQSSAKPLSFTWAKDVARDKLTNKAHTVGCFVKKGDGLVFVRQLPFL